MPVHIHPHTRTAAIFLILMVLPLAACGLPVKASQQAAMQHSEATQAAVFVRTEIARASLTATTTATPPATQTPLPSSQTDTPTVTHTPDTNITPTLAAVQATPQSGMALYTNPDLPAYVFEIDPDKWEKDPSGKTSSLVHKSMPNCRVQAEPGHGIGQPNRYFWQDLGRYRWEVMDYGSYAYVVPVLGASLDIQYGQFINLGGYNNKSCRAAEEQVLADLMPHSEAAGSLAYLPFQSPTPRPSLEGFTCDNTPPARLRVGDWVSVVTNSVWLRSAPRADDSTKVRQYLHYTPYMIKVIGGPVCEKYVYWQVQVTEFGEGGGTTEGWMAEGDPSEYYLVKVK